MQRISQSLVPGKKKKKNTNGNQWDAGKNGPIEKDTSKVVINDGVCCKEHQTDAGENTRRPGKNVIFDTTYKEKHKHCKDVVAKNQRKRHMKVPVFSFAQ